jgi:hypothetical protein
MRIVIAAVLVGLAAGPAAASSPDAWTAFRKDVGDKCLAQARATGMKAPEVIVHPVGTESRGIAVLREGGDKRICLYDKRAKTVELTPAT